jgi:hypothetical protein
VFELYRAADFCLVNSLHDGMNLVAKEFVASRDDEDGVLILSTFAGARANCRSRAHQSLRRQRDRGGHGDRHAHGARRAPRPHEPDAPDREGKQRLSLGGRMLMDASRIRQRQNLPSVKNRRFGTLSVRRRRRSGAGVRRPLQGLIAFGDAQPQQRHARRRGVEGRQGNGATFASRISRSANSVSTSRLSAP